jgi:hypothetical protein
VDQTASTGKHPKKHPDDGSDGGVPWDELIQKRNCYQKREKLGMEGGSQARAQTRLSKLQLL